MISLPARHAPLPRLTSSRQSWRRRHPWYAKSGLISVLILMLWVLSAPPGLAQVANPIDPAPAPETAPVEEAPYDPLNRTTPEGMVLGYIDAVSKGELDRASEYFDLRNIPRSRRAARGVTLAMELQRLLDQGGAFSPRWQLSDDPKGKLDDGLAPEQELVGNLPAPDGTVPIYVARIETTEGVLIWVFSSETVKQIPTLADQLEASHLDKLLPEDLKGQLWRGVPVGHWIAVLILMLLATLAAWLLTRILAWLVPLVTHRNYSLGLKRLLTAASPPVTLFLAVIFFFLTSTLIGVSIIARQLLTGMADIILIVAMVWFLWRMIDLAGETTLTRMQRRGHIGVVAAIGLFRRFGKIALIAVAFMTALDLMGFDVTTGLAALGIGGLAIALGAQKTVENFVGSLTLIADQPIRVGDFCRFGTTLGTVEDIGMRSTRVRTLDRTVITIPNGEFSSLQIENYNRRDLFWFHPTLRIRLDATPDQIRYLLVEVRKLLYAHPKVSPDPARIRFVGLERDALALEIFAYTVVADVSEYLDVQEDLLLRIMDIVQQSGTGFAYPSQTLYFAQDQSTDRDKAQVAEEQVRQWREAGDLPLPQFDPERIAALRGSLEYPPPGSVMRGKT